MEQLKELPEPTACCGAKILLWVDEKHKFCCPCGTTRLRGMELKEPTPCCANAVIGWIADKHHFACSCGKFLVNENGRMLGDKSYAFGKGRKPKATPPVFPE